MTVVERTRLSEEQQQDFTLLDDLGRAYYDDDWKHGKAALARIRKALEEALQDIDDWKLYKANIDAALNSGDGVCRP